MKYRFYVTYNPTDPVVPSATRLCFPLHSDELSVAISRARGEWYYTRNLDGVLTFTNEDYDWMTDELSCPFDGTFSLLIMESHDNGVSWFDYFSGTFSRASMEIDQDNRIARLNGLKESIYETIDNNKNEEYDLRKIIPDSKSKIVNGVIPPALAIVDYRSEIIGSSDIYCETPFTAGGFKEDSNYTNTIDLSSDRIWYLKNIFAEARVTLKSGNTSPAEGIYTGPLNYSTVTQYGYSTTAPRGLLVNDNEYYIRLSTGRNTQSGRAFYIIELLDINQTLIVSFVASYEIQSVISPDSIAFSDFPESSIFDKVEIVFHYIEAALLVAFALNPNDLLLSGSNPLDTSTYYKGVTRLLHPDDNFVTAISRRTVEDPNGHNIVPGSDDLGGTPQYFAPPDNDPDWIPLAESNWNYASMWYKVTPTVQNGLLDTSLVGTFQLAQCWTVGTCLNYLLRKITSNKVSFTESADNSLFLYGNPNPVAGGEPFEWLVTQKSNVMTSTKDSAKRCIVRLEWFFDLIRNALNCYYWLHKNDDGTYDFRIEHVEFFRHGGAYQGDLADQLDLTRLKPYRNFQRYSLPAKTYADQTNKYTFDLDGMVEKYTFSWQGDGGSDDFKGNPMFFRAGWIDKGGSEDHQVDNIFADLAWLMLNSGTSTASSKNYDGLFIFGGYRPAVSDQWTENSHPYRQRISLNQDRHFMDCDLWITAPAGLTITIESELSGIVQTLATYTTTGSFQHIPVDTPNPFPNNMVIRVNFGSDWQQVTIHRIHARTGNIYNTPHIANLLHPDRPTIQNGCLAWPWLQNEYLHYDIPASRWSFDSDDIEQATFQTNGTIKMVKNQSLSVVPVPDASTEDDIIGIMAVRTGLGIGIIDSAKVNLSSRNAEMTIIYDINPQSNQ